MKQPLDIRTATLNDLPAIRTFVDFWISGRGTALNTPGATNDYFVSPKQHEKYLKKYNVILLYDQDSLIGWLVIQRQNTLIHLLIAGTHRHLGFGTRLLAHFKPHRIRSKSNQSSGDPRAFYERNGYTRVDSVQPVHTFNKTQLNPNRSPIIDIFERT